MPTSITTSSTGNGRKKERLLLHPAPVERRRLLQELRLADHAQLRLLLLERGRDGLPEQGRDGLRGVAEDFLDADPGREAASDDFLDGDGLAKRSGGCTMVAISKNSRRVDCDDPVPSFCPPVSAE